MPAMPRNLRFTFVVLLWAIRSLARLREDLVLENLALRQQIAALSRSTRRVRLEPEDRTFWIALRWGWRRWADALVIVKPDTVVAWHRRAFRAYWRFLSRRPGRPSVHNEIRHLIRRMVAENPSWGAPCVHGELLKLGFRVSERTVSRYLPRRPPRAGAIREWMAFLRSHRDVLAGMDFFTVPTATFRVLCVFFVLHHDRRRLVLFNVTDHPTAKWVIQQIREAFPYDTAPRYVLFDRDYTFSAEVTGALEAVGAQPKRIGYRSPWQNGFAERWVGSCRRELLERVVVLGEQHLRRLLREYIGYYHTDRCHLALGKDSPTRRPIQHRPSCGAKVVALPRVGGLHHRYEWREAA